MVSVLVVASNLTIDHPLCLAIMFLWECHTFDSRRNNPVPVTTNIAMTDIILTTITAFPHDLLPVPHATSSRWLQLNTRDSPQ